jgi:uncharacterized protein YllA (UPF0747 family)
MSSLVRRRVLRPPNQPPTDPAAVRRREKRQSQLAADRQALRRWLTKLRRAFNTVDKLQARIARLERELSHSVAGRAT